MEDLVFKGCYLCVYFIIIWFGVVVVLVGIIYKVLFVIVFIY